MRSREHIEAQINEKLSEQVSGFHVVDKSWVEKSASRAIQELKTLSSPLHHPKNSKCEHIVDLIKNSKGVFIGEDEKLLIDCNPTDIIAFDFLYNFQQTTKKWQSSKIGKFLQIKEEEVISTYAEWKLDKEQLSRNGKKRKKVFKRL